MQDCGEMLHVFSINSGNYIGRNVNRQEWGASLSGNLAEI